MTTTIINILSTYGFDTTDTTAAWGIGSLACGQAFQVTKCGCDLYTVRFHHWFWDGGNYENDETEVMTLHGAQALQYIFENAKLNFA